MDSTIPPPSHMDGFCEDSDFITDPEMVWDIIPQPFRMIDKILNELFDSAWEIISNEELRKEAELAIFHPPQFEPVTQTKVSGNVNVLKDSIDGTFVFAGLPTGVAAISSSTSEIVAQWQENDADITQIEVAILCNDTYLLTSIDSLGVTRLFAFTNNTFYLLKKFNDQEGEKKLIGHKCGVSKDGQYLGVALENCSLNEFWLDVYHLPKEAWLKELESLKSLLNKQATDSSKDLSLEKQDEDEDVGTENDSTQQQDQLPSPDVNAADTAADKHSNHKFTNITQVLIIRPHLPKINGSTVNSVNQGMKYIESSDIIGSGENHFITAANLELQKQVFHNLHEQYLRFLPKEDSLKLRLPTFHFLSPGKVMPLGLNQMTESSAYIGVWWTGGTQFKCYSLLKQSKDVERKADVVWPFAHRMVSSAISTNNCSLAFGLENGTIIIWDKYLGIQRSVMQVADYPSQLQFLDNATPHGHALKCATYLMVYCITGETILLSCNISGSILEKPLLVQAKPVDHDKKATTVSPIKCAPELVVVSLQNGKIYICNTMKQRNLCEISLPETHELSEIWNPSFVLTSERKIYLSGIEKDPDESNEEASSTIFMYDLNSINILTPYWQKGESIANFPKNYLNLNDQIKKTIQERVLCQAQRQVKIQNSWQKLNDQLKGIESMHKTKNNIKVAS